MANVDGFCLFVGKKGLSARAARQPITMKNTRGECRGGQAAPLCNCQQCNIRVVGGNAPTGAMFAHAAYRARGLADLAPTGDNGK